MTVAWRALRVALAAAWAAVDARDVHFYGGLALAAFASSWRVAAVGIALALHAAVAPALIERLSRHAPSEDRTR